MLVDMVAAMPHFPALPQEPGRDFTPGIAAEPYSANPFVCADLAVAAADLAPLSKTRL